MKSVQEFVTGDAIWERIQGSLRDGEPARIAVPFIGFGASRWIKPAPGSWVLTRCDIKSARAGQVSGKDLLAWHRRGVRIFNLQALHAKVFAFKGAAYIGSSNASVTSRDRLVEAGVWTSNAALVTAAWEFVEQSCAEEVEETFLAKLAEAYRPPHEYPMQGESAGRKGEARSSRRTSRAQDEATLHLVRLYTGAWNDAQQAAADQAEAAGLQRVDEKVKAELSSFKWRGAPSRFAIGDLVLARLTDKQQATDQVLPWARVVGIRKVRGEDQHMVATATLKAWEELSTKDFSKAVGGLMKNFLGDGGRTRVATAEERAAVLNVWKHRNARLIL